MSIPSGSATTTNSITPTATAPLGAAATTTLANSAMAPLFNAAMHTRVTGAGSIGVTAVDQYSQNWSLTPLQDPDQLRRLRALYRFGAQVNVDARKYVDEDDPEAAAKTLEYAEKQKLLCEYPLA